MTELSFAARNYLAQSDQLRAMVAKSRSWDTWIADENPVGMKIEGTQKCMIVVTESDPWDAPNRDNSMFFPTLFVDVWADPTRNDDGSVQVHDAKNKIEDIGKVLKKLMHLRDPGSPLGNAIFWGTPEQIAARSGYLVLSSSQAKGPQFSPVRDSQGTWMGRYVFNLISA